jgi:UDP-N-acetylglucosamine 2-epimerase (non-hydrolysing)
MTVIGTRPEIIRLSRVIAALDKVTEQVLVHTGQNYDVKLNELFFEQLGVRAPDHLLGAKGSLGEQIGRILAESERLMKSEKPDRFLVLGDTNSALAGVMAKRLGIPVYHMVNRRIIDHCSDVLMPYTERSRQNLIREGFPGERIFVTGNPIWEVIRHHEAQIAASRIMSELALEREKFFLVTMHRAENVDVESRLRGITEGLERLQQEYKMPVIVSTHPRTREKMGRFGVGSKNASVRFLEPFGMFDFITLEKNAFCVLSDSGTVQEECAIFRRANVTIRDVTERPETIECGSGMLTGAESDTIVRCVRTVLAQKQNWTAPREYLIEDVSSTVVKIVLGYREARR